MQLKMKLLSDFCPASGEGLAGVIDTDVRFDSYGIPFIPAKRLKGCLRDAGSDLLSLNAISQSEFDSIFGTAGMDKSSCLSISDGVIENYDDIIREIDAASNNIKYKEFFANSYITDFFTSTRMQTQIDRKTSVAKENSLRSMRTISSGNVFYFSVDLEDASLINAFEKCCKVLRHMGNSRTRGLGEISLELLKNAEITKKIFNNATLNNESKLSQLVVTVKNETQLSFPVRGENADDTLMYIPGSSILGYFASTYIKKNKLSKKEAYLDHDFHDFFISGRVSFSNGYVSDETGREFFPTPLSIVKDKLNEKLIYNKLTWTESKPSKSLGKFSAISGKKITLKNPVTLIDYHHSRPDSKIYGHPVEGNGQFFQFRVIEKGQYFTFTITGSEKDLKNISELIPETGIMTFGRSKTAQYSRVKTISIQKKTPEQKNLTIKHASALTIQFLSPMLLLNENGYPTTDINYFISELGNDFAITDNNYIKTTTSSGYNSRKMVSEKHLNGISAGSIITLKYNGTAPLSVSDLENKRYGLKTNEGFGIIKILTEPMAPDLEKTGKTLQPDTVFTPENAKVRPILSAVQKKILENRIRLEAIEEAKSHKNLTPTLVNKVYGFVDKESNFMDFFDKFDTYIKQASSEKKERYQNFSFVLDTKKFDSIFDKVVNKEKILPELKTNEMKNTFRKLYVKTLLTQIKYSLRKGEK